MTPRRITAGSHIPEKGGYERSREAIPGPFGYLLNQARRAYALAKGAVGGDLGEGALENGELLVVQLRQE